MSFSVSRVNYKEPKSKAPHPNDQTFTLKERVALIEKGRPSFTWFQFATCFPMATYGSRGFLARVEMDQLNLSRDKKTIETFFEVNGFKY